MIITELTTNAVESTWKHGLYALVRLWMLGDRASVLLLVWDATDPVPVLRDATPDAEHGRGLSIVNDLSETWSYYHPAEQPHGKVVCAYYGFYCSRCNRASRPAAASRSGSAGSVRDLHPSQGLQ